MEDAMRLPAGADDTVLVAQITDLHLPERAGEPVAGVDTDESLGRVLDAMRVGLPRCPDLILASGDIADTGAASAYRRFRQYMDQTRTPSIGIPGNHDDPTALSDVWRGHLPQWVDTPYWRIVLLDSSLPGQDAGRLGAHGLARLRAALQDAPEHVLVVLHHHSVPVRSRWLDQYMLQDAGAFYECLDERVRAVLCGHVHQEQDGWYRSLNADGRQTAVRVLASPSTAFQFAPHTREFGLDAAGPAYRWLRLHPEGGLDTMVDYVPN